VKRRVWLVCLIAAIAALVLSIAVKRPPAPAGRRSPLIVIGIDGGEWKVIHRLWSEGKLPNLRALAGRGVSTTLRTAYNSSPVIWTTIATGVVPAVHGITDFVVATPQGDVPISSDLRKVPALWNMLSRTGRRVAVLGWWGSWPAEEVNGVVYTDRALLDLPRRVSPAARLPRFLEELRQADADPGLFGEGEPERRDRVMARGAARFAAERYDLILLYFRTTDLVSHNDWKYFEPASFPGMDPGELAANRDQVPRIYEAVDQEIGLILAAAPREANVIVLSDHGFHAAPEEEIKAQVDMDAILERLGYLVHRGNARGDAVDLSRTLVYTYASPEFDRTKVLRFGRVRPEEREALRQRLEADLATVTNDRGEPVFNVRDARPRRGEDGDLVAAVLLTNVTPVLRIQGRPFPPALRSLSRISGTHTSSTHGIFLAAGPDVDPHADLSGIHVHDMAPTILYGLGLPVAEDFAGRPRTELFSAGFRRDHPLRTIRSWGTLRRDGTGRSSPADRKLLDELRSLGYIR
jgi:predicted AlkP superfamily phosphohydrolase/phosphomutase